MNAVSFFLRRTRSSQKDARLQKLLSVFSLWGKRKREFLGVFLYMCKISVLDPPRRSVFSLFFIPSSSSSREVGKIKIKYSSSS